MKPSRRRNVWVALWALVLFILVSCILDDRTSKRGSEVENEVYGVLVALDGEPVQGAKVKAVAAGANVVKAAAARPAADSDSVVTDAGGRYSFKGLAPGRYNLFGDYRNGTLVVLIPDIDHRDTSMPKNQGIDTLRAPGRIRGRLTFEGSGEEGVLCYIPGTSYLAVSDDSGRFVLGGVPQGRHSLRCSKIGFQIDPDTGVVVRSGATTELPDKSMAVDPKLPPPEPKGLNAAFDAPSGQVRLSWRPVSVSDLQGYLVYRDDPDLLEPKAVRLVADTLFVDSTFPLSDTARTLTYRIRSRDKDATLSLNFSSPAQVKVPGDTAGIRIAWLGPFEDTVETGAEVRLVVGFDSPRIGLKRVDWTLAGEDTLLRSKAVSGRSGRDTLIWVAREGQADFIVALLDQAGKMSMAARSLTVLPKVAATKVDAGRDRTVPIGGPVTLAGKVPVTFGTVAKLEWRLGAEGGFRATENGDTTFVAPAGVDSVVCVFRATDDQGRSDSDSVVVNMIRPRKLAWNPTPMKAPFPPRPDGRMVHFRGRLFMLGGSIGKVIPENPEQEVIWETGTDIWSTENGMDWTLVTSLAEYGPRTPNAVLAFQGKLWAIFGDHSEPEKVNDVWSSEDGSHFSLVSDSVALKGVPTLGFELAGKMWIAVDQAHDSARIGSGYYLCSSVDGRNWTKSPAPLPFSTYGTPAVSGGRVYLPTFFSGTWSSTDATVWEQYPLDPGVLSRNTAYLAGSGDTLRMVGALYSPTLPGYSGMGVWSVSPAGVQELLTDEYPALGRTYMSAAWVGGRLLVFSTDVAYNPFRIETWIWSTR